MADCDVCARPQSDDTAYVCGACAARTRDALRQLADLAPELDVTVARQARTGDGGTGSDRDPLPVDLGAAYDVAAIDQVIATWSGAVARRRGRVLLLDGDAPKGPLCRAGWGCHHRSCIAIRERRAARLLPARARWLSRQVDWIRRRPDAAQALDELLDACRLAVRIVDRRSPRWYAGPCNAPQVPAAGRSGASEGDGQGECGADLYAAPGASTVRCPQCAQAYDAVARKDFLLAAARDTLAWAELIARALAALGLPCTRAQIVGWAHRGRLATRGTDVAQRVLYRVGDVIDLADAAAAAKTAA
jgi:hypothetical protein